MEDKNEDKNFDEKLVALGDSLVQIYGTINSLSQRINAMSLKVDNMATTLSRIAANERDIVVMANNLNNQIEDQATQLRTLQEKVEMTERQRPRRRNIV